MDCQPRSAAMATVGPAGRQRTARPVDHGRAGHVVAVVQVQDEQLPLLGEVRPVVAQRLLKPRGEVALHVAWQLAEPRLVAGMGVQERGQGPAPAVGLVALMGGRAVLQDLVRHHAPVGGQLVAHDLDASPARCFALVAGEVAQRQLLAVPAVRAQQFRDAFGVPRRPQAAQQHGHERVRPFVQQQVPAVVGVGLIVQPEVASPLVAVGERRQVGGQHAHALKADLVAHQESGHVPVLHGGRCEREVPAPVREGQIEHARQLIYFRLRRHVGVQRQVPAGQLADAGDGGFLVVDGQRAVRVGRPAVGRRSVRPAGSRAAGGAGGWAGEAMVGAEVLGRHGDILQFESPHAGCGRRARILQNPKSEARNPKQPQNPNAENSNRGPRSCRLDTASSGGVWNI